MNKLKEYITTMITESSIDDTIMHNIKQLESIKFSDKNFFERFFPDSVTPAGYDYEDPGRPRGPWVKVHRPEVRGPGPFKHDQEKITLVSSIKPLRKNKIVRGAGAGAFKYVYILDNNHVLSIFKRGYNMDDIKIFKKMYDAQFAGTGSKNDPAIYDISTIVDDEGKEISFVEMSQVIPVRAWFKMTGRESGPNWQNVRNSVKAVDTQVWKLRDIKNENIIDPQTKKLLIPPVEVIKLMKDKSLIWKGEEYDYNTRGYEWRERAIELPKVISGGLTEKETLGYLKMLLHVVYAYGWRSLDDMHLGNFGIMIQDPTTFIAYDI